MKKMTLAFAVVAMIGSAACGKDEAPPAPAAGSTAAAVKPEVKTTAEAAKPAAPAAPAAAAAQKGLEAGQVIVAYLQDSKDEGQCAALPVAEAEKAKYGPDKIQEVAKMVKGTVVPACPSANVIGTCKSMGMLVNYSGPKYAKDSAQADCTKNRGKWIE
jgi:ribosomal protein L11